MNMGSKTTPYFDKNTGADNLKKDSVYRTQENMSTDIILNPLITRQRENKRNQRKKE